MSALLVALGAAAGAPLRLLAGHLLDRTTHWGTLAVNLLGSALLGWVADDAEFIAGRIAARRDGSAEPPSVPTRLATERSLT